MIKNYTSGKILVKNNDFSISKNTNKVLLNEFDGIWMQISEIEREIIDLGKAIIEIKKIQTVNKNKKKVNK